jgi:hypothetical protein
VAFINPEG